MPFREHALRHIGILLSEDSTGTAVPGLRSPANSPAPAMFGTSRSHERRIKGLGKLVRAGRRCKRRRLRPHRERKTLSRTDRVWIAERSDQI